MNGRKRVLSLIVIMACNAFLVAAITIFLLYRGGIREERERLADSVQNRARLIETIARVDERYQVPPAPGAGGTGLLNIIIEAHNNYKGTGRLAEFAIGQRKGNLIVFLPSHLHGKSQRPQPVKFDSNLAEPMRRALLGQSGTMIETDHRGETVLAAYEPISGLDAGIVARIDLVEIRTSFVKAGIQILVSVVAVVLIGAVAVFLISRPMINRLEMPAEKNTAALLQANEQLQAEIDSRVLLQKQLEQSRSMFQSVVDGISDPLILLKRDFTIRMINRAAISYYNLSAYPDILYKTCYQTLRDRTKPCEDCEVPAAISSGNSAIFERCGFMDSDRIEQVYVYPVTIADEEEKNFLLRICDITEQRLFEKQLIHSEKMASLGLLASSLIHEINNPNNLITFNIPVLREHVDEVLPIVEDFARQHPDRKFCHMPYAEFFDDISRIFASIEHGTDRINELISNLKEFSQLKERVECKWIDIRSVVRKVLSICSAQLNRNGQSVIADIPDQPAWIWSDPHALEQILLNLLVNAAQASHHGGSRIELNVEIRDQWLEHAIMEVRDQGEGMDETTLGKIFNPFFTLKSENGGTGLGLYICHNLVESLGGRIEVESEPGAGSTFRVILPDKDRRRRKRG